MILISIYGRPLKKNVNKYRIDWSGKSRSKLQSNAKQFLYERWKNDIVFEEFPVFGSKMRVDFYNATKKIAIEVNGSQHDSLNPFFHNNSKLNFLAGVKRDLSKRKWLSLNGIQLIEIIDKDIKNATVFWERINNANL